MGIKEIFTKKPKQPSTTVVATTMDGSRPFYSDFGTDIYASDLVVDTINCISNEFKKLQPRHIVTSGNDVSVRTDSSISRVLRKPNEYMTTSEFLEKARIMLELTKNCFIYPKYTVKDGYRKEFTELYILAPSNVEYVQDAGGRYYIYFKFNNGYEITLQREDVIHWRKNYGSDDFFGGNGRGNSGLLRTVSEYDKLLQSISKAVNLSCQITGIYRINGYLADSGQKKKVEEFESQLRNSDTGIIATDLKAEYINAGRDIKIVDAETLNFFYKSICRSSGVSLPILSGDYNKEQKEAFYEHALEADIISLGQAFTDCMFTERERSFGNSIVFYPKDIAFMSMENKLSMLQIGLPAGMFSVNEARELVGYPPVEGGEARPRGYNNLDDEQSSDDNNDEGDERKVKIKFKRQFEGKKAERETRYASFYIRAEENEGDDDSLIIEGHAAVFDQETVIGELPWGFYEKIDKNAFDGADMSDVPLKYNHSDHVPILARTRNGSLELTVDEKGLKIRATLLDTQDCIDMYKKVKAGLLDKMSFAFTIKEEEVTEDEDGYVHRCITAFDRIFDVAIVDSPAYSDTEIYADSRKQVETWRDSLESEKQKIKRQTAKPLSSKTKQILLHYGG